MTRREISPRNQAPLQRSEDEPPEAAATRPTRLPLLVRQTPSRYTGVWRDASDKTPQMQAMREQAWLVAVHATTFSDGEDDIDWPDDWLQEWLPWASKSPTLWGRDDMRLGKSIYRLAYQVAEETPDFQIKPENVRRFSMIVARRGLREAPDQLCLQQLQGADVDQPYEEEADNTGFHRPTKPQPPSPPPGILNPFQQLLIKRIAMARSLTSVSAAQVSDVEVILDIIRKAEPSLIAELKAIGVDIIKVAQAQDITVDGSE